MAETFRVVLRDTKRYDTFEVREFDLPLDSTFPIGRASKNSTKKELLPAPNNAYIDSPVISREHAVLSANASSGAPHVYITDSGSMHGTMLNGRRLAPNAPEQLAVGDVLQFGIDVNRNEEYFVARNYSFEARLSRPFSLGFTVPDAESEDEVDMQESRGSQQRPLMIDDSDSASEQSNDDQPEVTLVGEAVAHNQEPAPPPPPVYEEFPESAMRTTLVEENYSEEEGGAVVYTSESEEEEEEEEGDVLGFDMDSEAASMGSSEPDYNSEREVPDSEDEEAIAASPFKVMSPYRSTATLQRQSSVPPSMPPMPPSMISQRTVQPRDLFNLEDMASSQAPGLPPLGMFNQNYDSNPFADNIAPPLPPRPSAPRPAPWHTPGFNAYAQQNDSQVWYSDEMPVPQSYLGTNFGDRPSLFSPAPPPPPPESLEPRTSSLLFSGTLGPVHTGNRLQTPPPMPTSDITTVTPPPNRRTKVSIEEIVEEQPLTPTSINSMKRKADVLEEEEEEQSPPVMHSLATPEEANEAVDAAAQTAAIIAQRPKKQPRSVMGKVFRGAAYPLLGAAGAVVSFTLLSTLPDAFFGA